MTPQAPSCAELTTSTFAVSDSRRVDAYPWPGRVSGPASAHRSSSTTGCARRRPCTRATALARRRDDPLVRRARKLLPLMPVSSTPMGARPRPAYKPERITAFWRRRREHPSRSPGVPTGDRSPREQASKARVCCQGFGMAAVDREGVFDVVTGGAQGSPPGALCPARARSGTEKRARAKTTR